MSSKVYFADFRCKPGTSQLQKLERLITAAGIDQIDFKDKFVAVKIHFGEWGNLSFLRQQYAKIVCDHIKARGGKPFLTDANTLYPGYRHNALDHLDVAYMNGYNPFSTGVQCIIADGLRGADEREIPVEGGKYVKTAKIGSAIADADIIVSLTHVKGHEMTGIGGVLKNIGMGSGSRRGKMEMHSSVLPQIDHDKCIGCGMCVKNCQNNGVHVTNGKADIDIENCLGCGHCLGFCPKRAITCKYDDGPVSVAEKIAEYTQAVLKDKPAFHVAIFRECSPNCDCDPGNDAPIIPDVGMFAGFDPVAIDQACVDKANEQPIMPNSVIGEHAHVCEHDHDVFKINHPDGAWEEGIIHGVEMGLGSREYELIEVK